MNRPVINYQCFLLFPMLLKEIIKAKTPSVICCCKKYSGRKITILKRKFVESEQKILESKLAANVIKKLNWENEKLFGRVIKTSQERKKEIEMGIINIGKETQRKTIKHAANDPLEGTPTHFLERGYKDIPPANFLRPEYQKPVVEAPKAVSNIDSCVNTNNSSVESDFDYFSTYYHENNFGIESSMKPPFRNVSLQEILQFPLVNPWRPAIPVNISGEQQEIKTVKGNLEKNEIYKGYPSVTKILNKTMDPEAAAILERWKKQMIKKLGEEGFQQYQQDLLDNGKSLHNSLVQFLQGTPLEEIKVNPSNKGHWKSLQAVLPLLNDVYLIESGLTHSFLMYKGVVDCVARYRDHLVAIDWKTSQKQKPTLSKTYDYPLQLAAYVGALNFDPQYKFMVNSALIVIAYEDGSESHTHFLTTEMCEYYWKEWLKRLYQYWLLIDNETD